VLVITAIVLIGIAVVEVVGRAVPARATNPEAQPRLFDTS
jgi:F0F1-type ATP synthase membrane subunit c/vacuolar-type H+-ATPase subunit K